LDNEDNYSTGQEIQYEEYEEIEFIPPDQQKTI
jgi:hypothetical protein